MRLIDRTFRRRHSLAGLLGIGLLMAGAGGLAPRRVAAAADVGGPRQQVPLPYSFHDNFGTQWDVQPDGCIGPATADIFDAGGRLFVGANVQFAASAAAVDLDTARNELIFPAQTLAGLNVSRRVCVDPKGGWCRWIEIVENPTAGNIKTQVHVNFDLGGNVQTSQNVMDERSQKLRGIAVFDGTRGIATLGAGHDSPMNPRIVPQQGNDQVDETWDVDIAAHRTIAIVHFQVIRPTANDALAFIDKLPDRDVLRDVPADLVKNVVNYRGHAASFGDAELLRGDLLDVVEVRGGDQYRGTLQDTSFSLQTAYGLISLPAAQTLAMLAVGEFRPTQLLITRDGEAFSGVLQSPALHMQLSSGQITQIPVNSVRRFGFRKRAGESDEFKYDRTMLMLRNGDRIAIETPTAPIAVATRYGNLTLDPKRVGAVIFQGEDQPVHQVLMTDGSRLSALVVQETLSARPLSTGAEKAISFPIAGISRLQIAPRIEEPGAQSSSLTLSTGDRLVGTLVGKLPLETAFDTIEINGGEIRGLHHAGSGPTEVQVMLWDETTLSGRLKGDVIDIALKSGPTLHVPAALIDEYSQPEPMPPANVLEKLRGLVADLASDDWKRADRASSELGSMGPRITAALRTLRVRQDKSVQERIDKILANFELPAVPASQPANPTGN